MENYIGKICPFCKTEIKEGEAVKICPACEVPHHESCWVENQGCTTFGCSEQHMEDQDKTQTEVCPNCGMALGNGEMFCPKCGQKIGLEVNSEIDSAISEFNAQVDKTKKKKKAIVIGGIVAVAAVLITVLAVILVPKIFKSAEDYMAMGDYEKAYSVAKDHEKDRVLLENMISFVAKDIPDSLKDSGSFSLRNAWFDKENQRMVLYVSGANSYGATASSYWYYTYDEEEKEYGLVVTLSDLDKEESYSWDSTNEKLEKLLKNLVRDVVKKIIADDSMKLDKDGVKNINHLFEEDILDSVKLLEQNK